LRRVSLEGAERVASGERREIVLLAAYPEVAATWSRYAAGEAGPDPHVHREHTDAFYVLEGELTFGVGPDGARIRVGPGGFVAVPPNVVHTFANDGGAEARWLNFHAADGGFAAYLRSVRDGDPAPWDSFDPPADGGRPAADAIFSPAGAGERLRSAQRAGLLKGVLPDLCVAEWVGEASFGRADVVRADGAVDAYYDVGGRVLHVHAPDGGFADALRRDAA
jgi:mannose-6-phosphate isomerase-like protein (cupin superfamily)